MLLAPLLMLHAAPPEDYRRLDCGPASDPALFHLDMPTPAFLRRYRGDNRVLYMLKAGGESTLDGVRFETVEDYWPDGVLLEWTDGNSSIHRLRVGAYDPEARTAPYTLAWDRTPRHKQVTWASIPGTCTLVHEDNR